MARKGPLDVLVPRSVDVVLLPHGLHHLAGQSVRDFPPVEGVAGAVAV